MGFFGSLFGGSKEPKTFGIKNKDKKKPKFKTQLDVDSQAFDSLGDLKGLYLHGDPGKTFFMKDILSVLFSPTF